MLRTIQVDESSALCIDTYLENSTAGSGVNFGTDTVLKVGRQLVGKSTAYRWRSLLRFDLRWLLAAESVESCGLQLFLDSSFNASDPLSAYRITQPAWTELGATDVVYDGSHAWTAAGGDFDATAWQTISPVISEQGQLVEFDDLLDAAVDALDNRDGWLHLLLKTNEVNSINAYYFGSTGHATPAWRPKLIVDYTPGEGFDDDETHGPAAVPRVARWM